MKRVGIAQLKNNLSRELRAVEAGEEVEVMDRARAIARIVPVSGRATSGTPPVRIRPAKRPFVEIRDIRYPPIEPGVDSVAILLEERRERGGR